MIEQDEFRIKMLTHLRLENRRVLALTVISTPMQVQIARSMRIDGWIGVTVRNGTKWVWITTEGRRVLRLFEKMYR